jgi:hypothetical protein
VSLLLAFCEQLIAALLLFSYQQQVVHIAATAMTVRQPDVLLWNTTQASL